MANYAGQQVDRSKSDGLGITESWELLFQANETAWECQQCFRILSDLELIAEMRRRFPGRHSDLMLSVHRMRAMFNRQKGRIIYYCYEKRKDGAARRITARGAPMTDWVVSRALVRKMKRK